MNALIYLISLISIGQEFPDAVYKTSVKFNLNLDQVEALEAAYDFHAN